MREKLCSVKCKITRMIVYTKRVFKKQTATNGNTPTRFHILKAGRFHGMSLVGVPLESNSGFDIASMKNQLFNSLYNKKNIERI